MTADPRAALALLVAALERHLEVAGARRNPDDPHVVAAALDLADAFDDYDEALFLATEVMTPLVVDADEEDDEDDDDDDEDDDDDDEGLDDEENGVYSGMGDDDLDYGDEDDEPTRRTTTRTTTRTSRSSGRARRAPDPSAGAVGAECEV